MAFFWGRSLKNGFKRSNGHYAHLEKACGGRSVMRGVA